jgi:hypothetical protein
LFYFYPPAKRECLKVVSIVAAFLLLTPNANAVDYKTAAAKVPKDQIAYAKCVSHHESRGNYKAVGDQSSARGRWQFLDKQWRRGLSFMVAHRLVEYGMPKSKVKDLVKDLQSKSIDRWNPIYQDVAFLAALNAKYQWSGWKHWSVNSKCNELVPTMVKGRS